jgi:hypothetical protein
MTLGYLSGLLTCTSQCGLDVTGCEPCASLDQHLLACGNAPLGSSSAMKWFGGLLDMAATDTDIGVTWLTEDASGKMSVWFARLGADLSLSGPPHLVADFPPPAPPHIWIAARKNGWLVAIETTGISTYELDATGAVIRSTSLAPNGKDLFLLDRSDGGDPLAVWHEGTSLLATTVNQDTASMIPSMIATGFADSAFLSGTANLSGAATTTGFIVVTANVPSSAQWERTAIHLNTTAQPDPPILLPAGQLSWLAPHGDGATVIYSTPDATVSWMHLDGSAHPMDAPVTLFDALNGQSFALLDLGADTGLIGLGLYYDRLDASGKRTGTSQQFAGGAAGGFVAVKRGPELVVAWLDYHRGTVLFARIAP